MQRDREVSDPPVPTPRQTETIHDLHQLVNIAAISSKAKNAYLEKRTEEIHTQLEGLFSLHKQREIEVNKGAETLSNFVSASVVKLKNQKAAADHEIKEKYTNYFLKVSEWEDEQKLVARRQEFNEFVKINGAVWNHERHDRNIKRAH